MFCISRNTVPLFILLLHCFSSFSQNERPIFTHQDTLRGTITKERAWWDLKHYELSVTVNIEEQSIVGKNTIQYTVLNNDNSLMQIDLQAPLIIHKITQNGKKLPFKNEGAAYFVFLKSEQKIGTTKEVTIEYSGKPHAAKHAPWDGGFTWSEDDNGKPFVATSCQGIGASIWWPCKDHMYDEADNGITINATIPKDLTAVCNGRLLKTENISDSLKRFVWQVTNPINNYGVNLNIGDYTHFSEKYLGEKDTLDMNYWVLKGHLDTAKIHFKEVPKMMAAFEHWFGPYPFYEDGYKLIEVPYLGMEHQSSVTYGNGFKNGYQGKDRSKTGWGDKFDFIIVHESGHEWFANNITYKDMADMWIHESFTAYSEALFVEYYYGKNAGAEYARGKRMLIANQKPMIANYGVNQSPTSDIYSKGTNMLHTLRQIVNNDTLWLNMLRGLNSEFYHQTVTTQQIENYMATTLNLDLTSFFNQYLRDKRLPALEYRVLNGNLICRWTNCIKEFDMPVKVWLNERPIILRFNKNKSVLPLKEAIRSFKIDVDYYVSVLNIMGD